MKGIWFDVQGCHLLVEDLDALLVDIGIKLIGDAEAGLGGGAGNRLDDGQITDQRLGAPVHSDEGEQLVLDAIRAQKMMPVTNESVAYAGRGKETINGHTAHSFR
jgi:hypothetical protein